MTLEVTFPGSGDYIHTQQSNSKSLYVHRDGDRYLFDVGEGTIRQMLKYNVKLNVDRIFLTGVRYNHSAGLMGILKTKNEGVEPEHILPAIESEDPTWVNFRRFLDDCWAP